MNIVAKASAALGALGLAGLAVFGTASVASADTLVAQTHFTPYSASEDWYAPTPATVDAPFAAPQTLKVLTCGGIHQHDEYTITSAKMDADYKAFIAAGVNSYKGADWEFNVHNYTVVALPDCVVKPPQPAPVVTTSTSNGDVNCDTKTFDETTTTTTVNWSYDEASNSWIKQEPVVTTAVVTKDAPDGSCPVVIPPKPDDKVVVDSHTESVLTCTGYTASEETDTTTPYVYDADTNTWVLGTPVTETHHYPAYPATLDELANIDCPRAPVITTSSKTTAPTCDAAGQTVLTTVTTPWIIKDDVKTTTGYIKEYLPGTATSTDTVTATTPKLNCAAATTTTSSVTPPPAATPSHTATAVASTSDAGSLAMTGSTGTLLKIYIGAFILLLGVIFAVWNYVRIQNNPYKQH